ncbi:MAG: hypothetical protein GC185_12825 [Alphaproteobacteria bacterium]|nr:hypothetical protein [Alphaproteobacteria bacterium]
MFSKTKSARRWLAKYSEMDKNALPAHLRRKLQYFQAAQALTIVAVVVGLFSYTVWMMIVGVLGAVVLLFMRKTFEPALDRAIERHHRMTDMMLGGGELENASPLERAKAKYLALPDGDPRVELALKEYKAELEKAKAAPGGAVVAETGKTPDRLEVEMEAAKARYLSLADDDPTAEHALQEYTAALKRVQAAKEGTPEQAAPVQAAPVQPVPVQPVPAQPAAAPAQAVAAPAQAAPPPPKPEIAPATALKIAEAKYLALKDGDPQMERVMAEYLEAKKHYEESRE